MQQHGHKSLLYRAFHVCIGSMHFRFMLYPEEWQDARRRRGASMRRFEFTQAANSGPELASCLSYCVAYKERKAETLLLKAAAQAPT